MKQKLQLDNRQLIIAHFFSMMVVFSSSGQKMRARVPHGRIRRLMRVMPRLDTFFVDPLYRNDPQPVRLNLTRVHGDTISHKVIYYASNPDNITWKLPSTHMISEWCGRHVSRQVALFRLLDDHEFG